MTATEDPKVLIGLGILYTLVHFIATYDMRLNQAKMDLLHSGVSLRAGGRTLPNWVGSSVIAGRVTFAALLIANWIFAVALRLVLFLLKVLPVLELMGECIMHRFLMESADNADGFSRRVRTHFQEWWGQYENQQLDLDDALTTYVTEYDLEFSEYADEPLDVTMARTKLWILDRCEFGRDTRARIDYLKYKTALQMEVLNHDVKRGRDCSDISHALRQSAEEIMKLADESSEDDEFG